MMSVCCSVKVLDFLDFLDYLSVSVAFCISVNKREWTSFTFTFDLPQESITFSVSLHQQLAQSPATAGQTLLGLIFGFSQLKVES